MATAVHVVARDAVLQPPLAAALRDTVRAQSAAGLRVEVVLLHDTVGRAPWLAAIPEVAAVHPRRDDLRRRGMPETAAALDDAGIVALLAAADRVASW